MVLRLCIVTDCGRLARGTRCAAHEVEHQRRRNQSRPQYVGSWAATSRRARKEQPWCTRCQASDELTLDHETGTVLCKSCNSARRRNVGEVRGADAIR